MSLWNQAVSQKYISNQSSYTLPKQKLSSGIASPSNWRSPEIVEEFSDEDDSHYQETTKKIIGSYLNEYIHSPGGYEDEDDEDDEDVDQRMKQAEWDAAMFDSSLGNSNLINHTTPVGVPDDEVAATSWLLRPPPATMGAFATNIISNMKETKPKLVTPSNYRPPKDHKPSTTALQYEIGPPLILYKNRPESGHQEDADIDGSNRKSKHSNNSLAVSTPGLSRNETQGTLNSHISKSSRSHHPPSSPGGFEVDETPTSMKKSKQALSDPLMQTKFRKSASSSLELSHKDLTHSNLPPALVRSLMKTSSLPSIAKPPLPDIKKSKKSI